MSVKNPHLHKVLESIVSADHETAATALSNHLLDKAKVILSEGLSEKGIENIRKWVRESDERSAAERLIAFFIRKKTLLDLRDLPDTATFANGLDDVEDCLKAQDYHGAFESAKETAEEMLEEEGYDG